MKFIKHESLGAHNAYGYIANSAYRDKDKMLASSEDELNEAVDWTVYEEKKGGIIIFSTDVNAVEMSKNNLVNWVKQKFATLSNRLGYNKKLDKIAKDHKEVYAWTIGKYMHGRYKAKNGLVYDENSLSIELINVSTDTLMSFARDVCNAFNQETVMVKNYVDNSISFVNGEEE